MPRWWPKRVSASSVGAGTAVPSLGVGAVLQTIVGLAVVIGEIVLEELAAVTRDDAAVERAEILQQIRHARERPRGQPGRDRGPRLIVEPADHRVDLGVAGLDRGDRRVEHLGRADLLPAHQLRQPHPVLTRELLRSHGSSRRCVRHSGHCGARARGGSLRPR